MASDELTTHSELRDIIRSEMQKLQEGMMSKLDTVSADMKHLSNRLAMVEKSVESINSQLSDRAPDEAASRQVRESAHQSMIASVPFNDPLNVTFFGIPIDHYEPGLPLCAMFRSFMREKLNIDPEKASSMAIHVQYLPRMSKEDYHSPICVTFRSEKDKDMVKHKVENHNEALRRLGIWVKGSYYLRAGIGFWKVK